MSDIDTISQVPSCASVDLTPELAGATMMVDLRALQSNYRYLAALAKPVECAAAVKAEAYGIGLVEAGTALWSAGCKTFFVALPVEGARLRQVLPDATIYVLNGLLPGTSSFLAAYSLRPVLSSIDEISEWAKFCHSEDRRLPAGIHVDTGINRLGLNEKQVECLAASRKELCAFRITLIISHLACGDTPNAAMNRAQIETFDRLRALLPQAQCSLANSAGTLNVSDFHYDLVRPGIALYGGNPLAERANPMKPVISLYGTILGVREVPAGETIGYSATWKAERNSNIAVISVGYADGFFRSLGGTSRAERAHVFVGGQFAPVIGRISMDMITVDVTDVPPEFARRGGRAELIGSHITIDDLARWAGTIPYEILTALGSRFARIYSPHDSS
ncbi:alanine racemase [Rhodoligotrophos appendicifer]|uniref:alanine racemase n=1 Tax=Rhodoligotrophos appendicifer TaxID=987056 RepID=UPI001184AB62|nr:alanine racemase [Rhodoligotrophos appendicifer]